MSRHRVDHAKAVAELHEALTARLAQMTTSDDWLTYLTHARKFHRYSPQNQLLLALQGAEGSVAGYRNWQRIPAHGGGTCQVRKGETGLKILAPLQGRSKEIDEVSGEEVTRHFLRGFRTVKVFHQGQLVAPPDIGQDAIMPKLLTGENRRHDIWSAVTEQLTDAGFDVALHSRTPMER
ncbi:ArdC family protein [Ilumatobacter sp.]|uniref:ArdC family protein n=1 Tax=Ilumatobacter sp. TaxID=1967498 RepID=UPI003B519C8A